MNRRDFTKSLAALGLTPALPLLPGTAATAAPAYTPYMYGLGAHVARIAGQSSPDMLASKLHLAPEAAHAMQAQLIRSGIISAPNAAGVATAIQPYMKSARVAGAASTGVGQKAKQAINQMMKDEPVDKGENRSDT